MTKIQNPISHINQIEKEAKDQIQKAEENAAKLIKQTEAKREEETAKAQNEALEDAKNKIQNYKEEIAKQKEENKQIIEKELAEITQNTKNNFSKISSFVAKVAQDKS